MHDQVAAVHDVSAWLKPNVGAFDHIKTARYFVIARRESDGLPVMWYKPCAAHQHLYPTLKDPETRMPMYEMANGEKRYRTDMNGIEVFSELPTGSPAVQPFEADRLQVTEISETVHKIVEAHPLLFTAACADWWKSWSDTTPTTTEEETEKHPMLFTWPDKAGEWQAPTLTGLEKEYSETITYVNTQARTCSCPAQHPTHPKHQHTNTHTSHAGCASLQHP